jgi:hypothetical protein
VRGREPQLLTGCLGAVKQVGRLRVPGGGVLERQASLGLPRGLGQVLGGLAAVAGVPEGARAGEVVGELPHHAGRVGPGCLQHFPDAGVQRRPAGWAGQVENRLPGQRVREEDPAVGQFPGIDEAELGSGIQRAKHLGRRRLAGLDEHPDVPAVAQHRCGLHHAALARGQPGQPPLQRVPDRHRGTGAEGPHRREPCAASRPGHVAP